MLVYDCEIQKCIPDKRQPNDPNLQYCNGWTDYVGMGISTICAWDYDDKRFRVFTHDNLSDFAELVKRHEHIIGFNSIRFDDPLCCANGVPILTTYDLFKEISNAAGNGKGCGQADMLQANAGIPKAGHGAMAPIWFQQGRLGKLIDYCLEDVRGLAILVRNVIQGKPLVHPTTGVELSIMRPSWMDKYVQR